MGITEEKKSGESVMIKENYLAPKEVQGWTDRSFRGRKKEPSIGGQNYQSAEVPSNMNQSFKLNKRGSSQ